MRGAVSPAICQIGLYENQLIRVCRNYLSQLRNRGNDLFVASSKPRVFVEQILEHFALTQYFSGVYGSELDGRLQDKGELLGHALAREGIVGSDSVMVGIAIMMLWVPWKIHGFCRRFVWIWLCR